MAEGACLKARPHDARGAERPPPARRIYSDRQAAISRGNRHALAGDVTVSNDGIAVSKPLSSARRGAGACWRLTERGVVLKLGKPPIDGDEADAALLAYRSTTKLTLGVAEAGEGEIIAR